MKKLLLYIVLATSALTSCMSSKGGGSSMSNGGEVIGIGGAVFSEPTPYGMVLIDRGSMKVGPAANDSVDNIRAD